MLQVIAHARRVESASHSSFATMMNDSLSRMLFWPSLCSPQENLLCWIFSSGFFFFNSNLGPQPFTQLFPLLLEDFGEPVSHSIGIGWVLIDGFLAKPTNNGCTGNSDPLQNSNPQFSKSFVVYRWCPSHRFCFCVSLMPFVSSQRTENDTLESATQPAGSSARFTVQATNCLFTSENNDWKKKKNKGRIPLWERNGFPSFSTTTNTGGFHGILLITGLFCGEALPY